MVKLVRVSYSKFEDLASYSFVLDEKIILFIKANPRTKHVESLMSSIVNFSLNNETYANELSLINDIAIRLFR